MADRLPDRILLARAVKAARPTEAGSCPRWAVVRDLFALGSTSANALCVEFGVDPDEVLHGPVCELCSLDHHDHEQEFGDDLGESPPGYVSCPSCGCGFNLDDGGPLNCPSCGRSTSDLSTEGAVANG